MSETFPDVKTLRRRVRWGIWLVLLSGFLMMSPNGLIAISGLPLAITGIVIVWPSFKHRNRIVESVPVPERTANRRKFGILLVIGGVGMAVLFFALSARVPREHLSRNDSVGGAF